MGSTNDGLDVLGPDLGAGAEFLPQQSVVEGGRLLRLVEVLQLSDADELSGQVVQLSLFDALLGERGRQGLACLVLLRLSLLQLSDQLAAGVDEGFVRTQPAQLRR